MRSICFIFSKFIILPFDFLYDYITSQENNQITKNVYESYYEVLCEDNDEDVNGNVDDYEVR